MAVPSPVGDLKIVSSISTFVLNTLTLTCCVGSHTLLHVVGCCCVLLRVVACCCMLLDVVACCCAKFETGQTFQPTTPNISFVP